MKILYHPVLSVVGITEVSSNSESSKGSERPEEVLDQEKPNLIVLIDFLISTSGWPKPLIKKEFGSLLYQSADLGWRPAGEVDC